MASLTSHRVQAVAGSLVDGLVVGVTEAALDHPGRSAARRRLYLVLAASVVADALWRDWPALRSAAAGMPDDARDSAELTVLVRRSLLTLGWSAVVTVVDGPLARLLRRHGARRPHLLIGMVAGAAGGLCTLPVLWARAADRAEGDRAAQELDDEIAELLTTGA
ncbi:hypothetical protein OF117_19210 [Geodermatophilus sp. YIM 151500]|uniref:hypothetical protein n=1 Tax=Geodermatophilus sp. YIM 151500 TaxID=2984531 RepID=UPI0021E48AFC|nr:hypothetical protein [Geodermatophilus sp. YIM 151500]MCV2491478.1 hypothetical protein [Geodermatophilus sp. YIM 151500]